MMTRTLHLVTTNDGEQIAVWKVIDHVEDVTMTQWYDWNLHKNFKSSFIKRSFFDEAAFENRNTRAVELDDRIYQQRNDDDELDYRQHMSKITIPIYAISARDDNFISPTRGCRLFFDGFNRSNNIFREYSLSNGDLDDHTHSRIMISRNTATEIWPTVTAWIEKHTS